MIFNKLDFKAVYHDKMEILDSSMILLINN